jgi:hypothetical protein
MMHLNDTDDQEIKLDAADNEDSRKKFSYEGIYLVGNDEEQRKLISEGLDGRYVVSKPQSPKSKSPSRDKSTFPSRRGPRSVGSVKEASEFETEVIPDHNIVDEFPRTPGTAGSDSESTISTRTKLSVTAMSFSKKDSKEVRTINFDDNTTLDSPINAAIAEKREREIGQSGQATEKAMESGGEAVAKFEGKQLKDLKDDVSGMMFSEQNNFQMLE